MAFVLDNSVMIGWCFQSQATKYSDQILDLLNDETAHVPSLWVLEFSNILGKSLLTGKIDSERASALINTMNALPIVIDHQAVSVAESFKLAIRYGLTSYDAAYLELALRLQLPIASNDLALRNAAIKAGLALVKIAG